MNNGWKNVKENPPVNGEYVAVRLHSNLPSDKQNIDVACYCNGDFYKLTYDPHLDVLRKTFYDEKVDFWTELM
jgi:hypothetical protein